MILYSCLNAELQKWYIFKVGRFSVKLNVNVNVHDRYILRFIDGYPSAMFDV